MTRKTRTIRTYKTRTIHTYYCTLRDGRQVYNSCIRDVTHQCVRDDSFIRVTWLIHVCEMTHSCVWRESSMIAMAHCACRWRSKTLFIYVFHLFRVTHSRLSHDSISVISRTRRPCHKCDTNRDVNRFMSQMWHIAFRTLGWSVKVSSELTKPTSFTTFLTRFKSPPHASFTWKSTRKWEYGKRKKNSFYAKRKKNSFCICSFEYAKMHFCIFTWEKRTWEYAYAYVCADIYTCVCMNKSFDCCHWLPYASFAWKSKCKWEYVKMHMTICIHIYIYMYGHTCICMHGSFARKRKMNMRICMDNAKRLCINADENMYTHIYIYICANIYTYLYIYICM